MIKSSCLLMILFVLCGASIRAQSGEELYERKRLLLNFENLKREGKDVYFEQRIYRNTFIGLYQINKALADTAKLNFIPLFQGVPLGRYTLEKNAVGYKPLTREERLDFTRSSAFPLHLKNYKFDFWIQPYFTAIFGNFERPVESNTSVALQTQFFIVPGLSLNTGILFPIINQMDGRPKTIRPAPTFLNHFFNSGNHFFSTSLGFFNNDQYGINVQYRHADLSKPFSFGLETGYTGFYYYPRGGIYYESLNQFVALADVAYRFKGPDFTAKLTAGQFMWSDKGARVDLIRQFTNVELGFYATKTQNGSTLGFNFAIPIPPGKLLQGKNARLRTTDEFRWEYTYTRGYKIGERYRVGYQLDQKLRQYHRDYLNRQWQMVNATE